MFQLRMAALEDMCMCMCGEHFQQQLPAGLDQSTPASISNQTAVTDVSITDS